MSGLRERLLVGGALAVIAAAFAWLNGGVRVVVDLGFVRFDAAPLPIVVFVAFLLGMLTLFLASLKADLRMQRMLRRYREALGRDAGTPLAAGNEPGADPAGKET
ncbi:MAG TPA: LapA family protein [Gemmatimonadota bacterium]|nr:LapA family protein [Gemmatimonadota bacterium]